MGLQPTHNGLSGADLRPHLAWKKLRPSAPHHTQPAHAGENGQTRWLRAFLLTSSGQTSRNNLLFMRQLEATIINEDVSRLRHHRVYAESDEMLPPQRREKGK
jgi:hypothetical protein